MNNKTNLDQLPTEQVLIFRGFKQDCPDGQLGKDKILEMYSMILPAGNAKGSLNNFDTYL